MFCDKCGNQFMGSEKYCGKCGSAIQEMMQKNANQSIVSINEATSVSKVYGTPPKKDPHPKKKTKPRVIVLWCVLLLLTCALCVHLINFVTGWELYEPVSGREILIHRFLKGIQYNYDPIWSEGEIIPDEIQDAYSMTQLHRMCEQFAGELFIITYTIDDCDALDQEEIEDIAKTLQWRYSDQCEEANFYGEQFIGLEDGRWYGSTTMSNIDEIYQYEVYVEVKGMKDNWADTVTFWVYLMDDRWYVEAEYVVD